MSANSPDAIAAPSGREELLAAARALAQKSGCIEADLLVHLGEVDERKLSLARSSSSMSGSCIKELNFSEDAS